MTSWTRSHFGISTRSKMCIHFPIEETALSWYNHDTGLLCHCSDLSWECIINHHGWTIDHSSSLRYFHFSRGYELDWELYVQRCDGSSGHPPTPRIMADHYTRCFSGIHCSCDGCWKCSCTAVIRIRKNNSSTYKLLHSFPCCLRFAHRIIFHAMFYSVSASGILASRWIGVWPVVSVGLDRLSCLSIYCLLHYGGQIFLRQNSSQIPTLADREKSGNYGIADMDFSYIDLLHFHRGMAVLRW